MFFILPCKPSDKILNTFQAYINGDVSVRIISMPLLDLEIRYQHTYQGA